MIAPRLLSDKEEIAARLSSDPALHLYELGDLDPFFFRDCRYWAHPREPVTAMLYEGAGAPTLLALERTPASALAELVSSLCDQLPREVYAHLAVGLVEALTPRLRVERHGVHDKMARRRAPSDAVEAEGCEVLGPEHLAEVTAFYEAAYPGSWFEPRMLQTRAYVAVREPRGIVAVAGVHVLSPQHGVAAIGNVATSPDRRGRGLARRACAGVLRALDPRVSLVGLNVAADNAAAIACYRGLGFERVARYEEVTLTRS